MEVQNRGFYFRLWLTSISSLYFSPQPRPLGKRVKRAIKAIVKGLLSSPVRDGRTYALNLQYVQMGEFFRRRAIYRNANQRSSEIRLYLAGRGAEAFRSADPKELAAAFTALQTGSHEGVLTFSEKNGSTLMVRTNELMLLESWTEYVKMGLDRH